MNPVVIARHIMRLCPRRHEKTFEPGLNPAYDGCSNPVECATLGRCCFTNKTYLAVGAPVWSTALALCVIEFKDLDEKPESYRLCL